MDLVKRRAGHAGQWHRRGRRQDVDALRLIFRAELRRRWRSWLALAILIAVVGGVVMASAAAGRRTASAFPTFVRTHGYDFVVFNGSPAPGARPVSRRRLDHDGTGRLQRSARVRLHAPDRQQQLQRRVRAAKEMSRTVNLVAGRMPNPSSPDEVLASFNLQRDNGVHVGTVLRMRMYAASQSEAVNNATGAGPPPTGPFVSFHVVGMEAAVDEFQAGTTPLYDVYTTPAFARSVLPKTTSGFLYLVKLRHGAADVDAFKTYAKSLGIDDFTDLSTPEVLIAGSIHPQAVGWWLLAALAALAGAAVVGQALSRTRRVESDEFPILQALGLGRSVLVALGMASTLLVALVGAAGALALAYALSPFAPVGDARLAEPSTGLRFDGPVLLLGALATVVVVLALGVWPSLRAARGRADAVRPRPSAVVRCRGRGGCAADHGGRGAQRARTRARRRLRAGGHRAPGRGARRGCAVRHRRLRVEPLAPRRHPVTLRRYLPGDHLRNTEHIEHGEPSKPISVR